MIENVIIVSPLFTLRLRASDDTYETVSIVLLFVGIDKISPPIVMMMRVMRMLVVVVVVGSLRVVEITALLLLHPHQAAHPA